MKLDEQPAALTHLLPGVSTRRAPIWRRVLIAFGVPLVVVAIAVAGLRAQTKQSTGQDSPYQMDAVRKADIHVTVVATGTLESVTTVDVGAEVTGRVLQVLVAANEHVQKGELLAVIDQEQLTAAAAIAAAQVTSSDAAVSEAHATLTETRKAAERATDEARSGLVASKDLEAAVAKNQRAEAALTSAVANANLSRATLKQARARLDKSRIASPIDGIVLSRHVEPGQTITAGFATPLLFRLAADLTKLRLNVDIDEADIGRVREGQEATFTVSAYPDEVFSSRVLSLRNEPKTTQGVVTYQGVLAVDNERRLLRPGMTCSATISAEARMGVTVVPNAALRFVPPVSSGLGGPKKEVGVEVTNAEKHQRVYIVTDGKLIPRYVQTGATDGAVTEVLGSDLRIGTEVVVDLRASP